MTVRRRSQMDSGAGYTLVGAVMGACTAGAVLAAVTVAGKILKKPLLSSWKVSLPVSAVAFLAGSVAGMALFAKIRPSTIRRQDSSSGEAPRAAPEPPPRENHRIRPPAASTEFPLPKSNQLHAAVRFGLSDTCKRLLERIPDGQSVDLLDDEGYTPLQRSCRQGYSECGAQLINRGADPAMVQPDGQTPLHSAVVHWKNPAHYKELLKRTCDVNCLNGEGETALYCAVSWGRTDHVLLLLEKGADPLACGEGGTSALAHALSHSKRDILQPLIEAVSVDALHPLLKHASVVKLEELMELLLEKGVDPTRIDAEGDTLLHRLARDPYDSALAAALKGEFNVDALSGAGRTALEEAVRGQCYFNAQALLKRGADPRALSEEVRNGAHDDIRRLLEEGISAS